MYTADQTIEDQRDLASLCADRSLITNQAFAPNAFYGISNVLNLYAGKPTDYSIKAVIPHGIVYDEDYIWNAEVHSSVPVVFNFSNHRFNVYKLKTNKIVFGIASPFYYVHKLIESFSASISSRNGTIFFPIHSSSRVENKYDNINTLIDKLDLIEEKYRPITVCVYWKDYLRGQHKEFLRRGYNVVSAGHIYDPSFLFRLYHLLSIHYYAASNEIGTHIPYSIIAGCEYFHINNIHYNTRFETASAIEDRSSKGRSYCEIERILKLSFPSDIELKRIVDELTGVRFLRSPKELALDFNFSDSLDRRGFAKYWGNDSLYFSWPYAQKRIIINRIKSIRNKFFYIS